MAYRVTSKTVLGVAVAATACWLQAQPLGAQEPKRTLASAFAVNEKDPEASVPTPQQAMKNPLEMGYFLMDLSELAEAAQKRGDHAQVVKLYRAMAKAVPDRSVSYARQCDAYEAMGDVASALSLCRQALGTVGVTAADYAHFVRLVVAQPGALSSRDIEDVDAVLAHLTSEGDKDLRVLSAQLGCELGARMNDEKRLVACTDTLATLAPTDAKTFGFQWTLALQRGDREGAVSIMRRAASAKVPAQVIAQMQNGLVVMEHESRADTFEQALVPKLFGIVGTTFVALLSALIWLTHKRRTRHIV